MPKQITKFSSDTNQAAGVINRLHGEIVSAMKTSLEKAFQIGELLCREKTKLGHGMFGPWCASSLPFSQRTAGRFMRLHLDRDRLKLDSVTNLTEAYRLLADEKCNTHVTFSDDVPDWKPGPGHQVYGTCPDGRGVLIEGHADGFNFRWIVGDDTGFDFAKRWMFGSRAQHFVERCGVDLNSVEWADACEATAENNPWSFVLPEWRYDGFGDWPDKPLSELSAAV